MLLVVCGLEGLRLLHQVAASVEEQIGDNILTLHGHVIRGHGTDLGVVDGQPVTRVKHPCCIMTTQRALAMVEHRCKASASSSLASTTTGTLTCEEFVAPVVRLNVGRCHVHCKITSKASITVYDKTVWLRTFVDHQLHFELHRLEQLFHPFFRIHKVLELQNENGRQILEGASPKEIALKKDSQCHVIAQVDRTSLPEDLPPPLDDWRICSWRKVNTKAECTSTTLWSCNPLCTRVNW